MRIMINGAVIFGLMAAPAAAVDRSKLIISKVNFSSGFNDFLVRNGGCRFPTSLPAANRLIRRCDPKGSKQRCNEFSTFKGGPDSGPPIFLVPVASPTRAPARIASFPSWSSRICFGTLFPPALHCRWGGSATFRPRAQAGSARSRYIGPETSTDDG